VDRATINKIEQGKRSPSIATLESLSRALTVEVADFFPKAQAPLPEPTFEDLMNAELRGGATDADIIGDYEDITRSYRMAWRGALGALAASWEQLLRSGAFDRSMVEQFFSDVAAISPFVSQALSAHIDEQLLKNKYKSAPTASDIEELWASDIASAGMRLISVSDEVWAAAVERFSESELEAARRKRDEARRALGNAA
jgi:transcriptional regulator with XRE-family HTH domain